MSGTGVGIDIDTCKVSDLMSTCHAWHCGSHGVRKHLRGKRRGCDSKGAISVLILIPDIGVGIDTEIQNR